MHITPAIALLTAALSADPNAPVSNIAVRGKLRATIATTLPFVGAPGADGLFLQLPAFIELHNDTTNAIVPFEYWRARLWLEAGWRGATTWTARPARYALSILAEHESDHPTAWTSAFDFPGEPGFVNFNSVASRGRLDVAFGEVTVEGAATLRLHVLTCTNSGWGCGLGGGLAGSAALEGAGELIAQGPVPDGDERWFASLAGSWLVPHGLAIVERRVVAHAGLAIPTDTGWYAPYLVAFVGNDVGYHRDWRVAQVGIGVRWIR